VNLIATWRVAGNEFEVHAERKRRPTLEAPASSLDSSLDEKGFPV
jgi:hypothetical protein